jgi:ElaB/YqjD/DUF883 family membrane-anchored ribosome-binding protein
MFRKSHSARETLAQAAERASDAGQRLVEIGSAMQEKAHDAVRTTRRTSEEYSGRLRDSVVDYPLAMIGIAVAVGALISVLLARRWD